MIIGFIFGAMIWGSLASDPNYIYIYRPIYMQVEKCVTNNNEYPIKVL